MCCEDPTGSLCVDQIRCWKLLSTYAFPPLSLSLSFCFFCLCLCIMFSLLSFSLSHLISRIFLSSFLPFLPSFSDDLSFLSSLIEPFLLHRYIPVFLVRLSVSKTRHVLSKSMYTFHMTSTPRERQMWQHRELMTCWCLLVLNVGISSYVFHFRNLPTRVSSVDNK